MDMEEEVSVDQDLEAPMEAWQVHHTVDLDSEDQDMDHHHQDTDQGMDHLRREVDLEAQEDLYVVV